MSSTVGEAGREPVGEAGREPVGEAGWDAVPEDPGERRRRGLKKSVRDMTSSMLVIVGIAVVIMLLIPRPNAVPPRSIDVASVAVGAQPRLDFTPAAPVGLPGGWVATSVEVRDSADGITTWHVGYLTADGHYASIEQAADVTTRWEEIMDSGGLPAEPQTVDGASWEQRYKDVREVHALIHRGTDSTIMVTSKGGGLQNALTLARSIPASAR